MSANLRDSRNKDRPPGNMARERLFYAKLLGATDLKDFTQKIQAELHRLDITDFALRQRSTPRPYPVLLTSLPEGLTTTYNEKMLYRHDLTLDYLEKNTAPIYQSVCHEHCENMPFATRQTDTMRALFELNSHYGMFDYYHMPYKACNGQGYRIFSVAIKGVNPVDFRLTRIRGKEQTLLLLAQTIDAIGVEKFPDLFGHPEEGIIFNPKKVFNRQPLRVLTLVANNDCDLREVARKLQLSEVTIHVHLKAARDYLGVKTTHAAIRKCVLAGLIEYEEDEDQVAQLRRLSRY